MFTGKWSLLPSSLAMAGPKTLPGSASPIQDGIPGSRDDRHWWVGLNWGLNGARGGGDDTWITSGSNTQLVDEIFGRGSGNAYAAYCSGCTVEQQQAQIEAARAHPGQNYTYTARYTIALSASDLASGETTVQITETPEPAGWVMMGLGIAGLWWLRRLDASRG